MDRAKQFFARIKKAFKSDERLTVKDKKLGVYFCQRPCDKYQLKTIKADRNLKVYKLRLIETEDEYLAVKEYDTTCKDRFNKEVVILTKCLTNDNNHVVQFFESFYDSDYKKFFLVMEYCPGGDLTYAFERYDKKGKKITDWYSEGFVRDVVKQCCEALKFLHGKEIVHRDVKLSNIFVRSWDPLDIALGDMNCSKDTLKDGDPETDLGTPGYIAPEIRFKELRHYKEKKLVYDNKVDVFGLGMVAWLLVCGTSNARDVAPKYLPELPVDSMDNPNADKKIIEQTNNQRRLNFMREYNEARMLPRERWETLSQNGKDAILAMLRPLPERRAELGDIADHNWMEADLSRQPKIKFQEN